MVQSLRRSKSFRILFNSPELVEEQRSGFHHFLKHGLREELSKISFLEVKRQNVDIEVFLDANSFQLIAPDDNSRNCVLKMKTYACKLYVQIRIVWKKKSGDLLMQTEPEWVLLAHLPMMTKRGHFIINGSPRVIVHQVVRAPGVYFQKFGKVKNDERNKARFYGDIIPRKGVWVRLQISKTGQVEIKLKKSTKVQAEMVERCLAVIEKQEFSKRQTFAISQKDTHQVELLSTHEKGNANVLAPSSQFKRVFDPPSGQAELFLPRSTFRRSRTFSHFREIAKVRRPSRESERKFVSELSNSVRDNVLHKRAESVSKLSKQHQVDQRLAWIRKAFGLLLGCFPDWSKPAPGSLRIFENFSTLRDSSEARVVAPLVERAFAKEARSSKVWERTELELASSALGSAQTRVSRKLDLPSFAWQTKSSTRPCSDPPSVLALRTSKIKKGYHVKDQATLAFATQKWVKSNLEDTYSEKLSKQPNKFNQNYCSRSQFMAITGISKPFLKLGVLTPEGGNRNVKAAILRSDNFRETKVRAHSRAITSSSRSHQNMFPAPLGAAPSVQSNTWRKEQSTLPSSGNTFLGPSGLPTFGRQGVKAETEHFRFSESLGLPSYHLNFRGAKVLEAKVAQGCQRAIKSLLDYQYKVYRGKRDDAGVHNPQSRTFVVRAQTTNIERVAPPKKGGSELGLLFLALRSLLPRKSVSEPVLGAEGSKQESEGVDNREPTKSGGLPERRPPILSFRVRRHSRDGLENGVAPTSYETTARQSRDRKDLSEKFAKAELKADDRAFTNVYDNLYRVPEMKELEDKMYPKGSSLPIDTEFKRDFSYKHIFATFKAPWRYTLGTVGRHKLNKKFGLDLYDNQLTSLDLQAARNWLVRLRDGKEIIDDIDHFQNRRIRQSGELIQNQFENGVTRLRKLVRKKLRSPTFESLPFGLLRNQKMSPSNTCGTSPGELSRQALAGRFLPLYGRQEAERRFVFDETCKTGTTESAGFGFVKLTRAVSTSSDQAEFLFGRAQTRGTRAFAHFRETAGTRALGCGAPQSKKVRRPERVLWGAEHPRARKLSLRSLLRSKSVSDAFSDPLSTNLCEPIKKSSFFSRANLWKSRETLCFYTIDKVQQIPQWQLRINSRQTPFHYFIPRLLLTDRRGLLSQAWARNLTGLKDNQADHAVGRLFSKGVRLSISPSLDSGQSTRTVFDKHERFSILCTIERSVNKSAPLASFAFVKTADSSLVLAARSKCDKGQPEGSSHSTFGSVTNLLAQAKLAHVPRTFAKRKFSIPTRFTKSISLTRDSRRDLPHLPLPYVAFGTCASFACARKFVRAQASLAHGLEWPLLRSGYFSHRYYVPHFRKAKVSTNFLALGCGAPQSTRTGHAFAPQKQAKARREFNEAKAFSLNGSFKQASELFSTKPINGALREFFGSNPLSQYMDQTNPLAELTHKRRLSSLGIGGVSRESAGMAIRGIHPTHYGRICPIETPEGKNAGLVNSLALYARLNKHGFIETPYYKVRKGQVQEELGFSFYSALKETVDRLHLAPSDLQQSQANMLGSLIAPRLETRQGPVGLGGFLLTKTAPSDDGTITGTTHFRVSESEKGVQDADDFGDANSGCLVPVRVADTLLDVFKKVTPYEVDCIGISPVQILSVATSLIPFLEHNDANRALMGSNMQRQAVPLMISERPIVGTGLETLIAAESGQVIQSSISGLVSHVSANKIIIERLFNTEAKTLSDQLSHVFSQTFDDRPRSIKTASPLVLYRGEYAHRNRLVARRPFAKPLLALKGKHPGCLALNSMHPGCLTFAEAKARKLHYLMTSRRNDSRLCFQWTTPQSWLDGILSTCAIEPPPNLPIGQVSMTVTPEQQVSTDWTTLSVQNRVRSISQSGASLRELISRPSEDKTAPSLVSRRYLPHLHFRPTVHAFAEQKQAKVSESVNEPVLGAFGSKQENLPFGLRKRESLLCNGVVSQERGGRFFRRAELLLGRARVCPPSVQRELSFVRASLNQKSVLEVGYSTLSTKTLLRKATWFCVSKSKKPKNRVLFNELSQLYKNRPQQPQHKLSAFGLLSAPDPALLGLPLSTGLTFAPLTFLLWGAEHPRARVPAVVFSCSGVRSTPEHAYRPCFCSAKASESERKLSLRSLLLRKSVGERKCKCAKLLIGPPRHRAKRRGSRAQTSQFAETFQQLTLLPFVHSLRSFSRSNQETCLTQKPLVQEGEWVQKGDLLTDCSASEKGELAVGKNVMIAYLPWEGYNFEDAIVVSDRLTKEQIYASLHIERYVCEAQDIKEKITNSNEWFTRDLPGVNPKLVSHLDTFGFPKIGTILKEGDILVGKMRYFRNKPTTPYEKLLSDILGDGHFSVSLTSLRVPKGVHEARVISHRVVKTFRSSLESTLTGVSRPAGTPKMVNIFLGEKRSIQIGDKMSGRHGNKGIISTILPKQDMPYLPDGSPIDILLNPLGVPSRMNVGQIFESLLGLASTYLNQNFKITAFDELYGVEASQSLVYLKLYQARLQSGQNWLFQINFPGKTRLIDGRSGECFDQWVTVGRAYMLKLIHMVNEKIHARNTGPYALITQQPLRGRSQKGGQRLGEMEVWALEGYGAAYILQELLTKKSDDFAGRQEIINSLVVRSDKFSSPENPYRNYSNPDDPYQRFSDPDNPYQVIQETRLILGHPEIFKTLICELQALCLDVGVYALKKESFQREYLGIVS